MHIRDRGAAVIIEVQEVALIKRNRDGEEYFVFPGGGIEKGESPEQATIREAFEELGVRIDVIKCFGTVEFKGKQHYF
uniref:NUDIX domain-containing protein n=1 Tax=Escherichia coli TaxID=562 RepID=UPI001CC9FCA5